MDNLTYYMGIIKKNLNSFLNESFKPLNISGAEAPVMKFINENPCCRQIDIAKKFGCDKAHTHRVISKLIEKKFVEYHNEDKQELCLTAAGKDIIVKINDGLSQCKKILIKNITAQELDSFFNVLKKCAENTRNFKRENNDD